MRSFALFLTVVLLSPTVGCGGNSPASPAVVATPAPTPVPTPAVRRTDTFGFVLGAGSLNAVVVGPVYARSGPLEVRLDFSGDFIILACVGTRTACTPMGGRPMTTTFNITTSAPTSNVDYPEGPIQASLYFNPNYRQPAGDAQGTVSFTYNPL